MKINKILIAFVLAFIVWNVQAQKASSENDHEQDIEVQPQKKSSKKSKKKNFIPKDFVVRKHQFNWSLFSKQKKLLGYFKQVPDYDTSRIELVTANDKIKGIMEYDLTFIPFLSNEFTIKERNGEFLAKVVDSSGFIFGGKRYSIYNQNDQLLGTMKCNYESIADPDQESLVNLKIQAPFLGNRKWHLTLLKGSSVKLNRIVFAFLPLVREFDSGFFRSFTTEL